MTPIDRVVSVHEPKAVRRPAGTSHPDVLAVHELIVAAHEGTRRFLRQTAIGEHWGWHYIAGEVDDQLDRAQSLIEALR